MARFLALAATLLRPVASQASSSSLDSHMSTEARAPGVSEASIALNA